MTDKRPELDPDLDPRARAALEKVLDLCLELYGGYPETGPMSGTAFYTGQQWRDRGESYGQGAVAAVVHEGSVVIAPLFSLDAYEPWSPSHVYDPWERAQKIFNDHGLTCEQGTTWFSVIYPDPPDDPEGKAA